MSSEGTERAPVYGCPKCAMRESLDPVCARCGTPGVLLPARASCCVCGTREPVACGVCLGISAITADVDWYVRRMSQVHAQLARARALLASLHELHTDALDSQGWAQCGMRDDRPALAEAAAFLRGE